MHTSVQYLEYVQKGSVMILRKADSESDVTMSLKIQQSIVQTCYDRNLSKVVPISWCV